MAGVDIPPLSSAKDPGAIERWARKVSDAFNTVVRDMQKLSGSYYVWDKGSLAIPQNTTIAGAEEIVFESNFSGNGVLLLTVVGAAGGVNVALNGTELGELTDADTSSEIVHKVAASNLVNGLNSLKIWDDAGDTAELRKVVHSTVKAEATRVNDNLFDRTDRWPAVLDTLYADGFYFQDNLNAGIVGLTTVGSGTAGGTTSNTAAFVAVTTSSSDLARCFRSSVLPIVDLTWDKDREWRTRVKFEFGGGDYSNTAASISCGDAFGTLSGYGVGFALNGSTTLLAYSRVAGTTTSASTGVAVTNNSNHLLEIDFVAGVKADFYVNGTLTNTITTNLPTGTNSANLLFHLELDNSGTASGTRALRAGWVKFAQHP